MLCLSFIKHQSDSSTGPTSAKGRFCQLVVLKGLPLSNAVLASSDDLFVGCL